MSYPGYMLGPVVSLWVDTDDKIITCIVCDGDDCDLERTSRRGGKRRSADLETVGLHTRCLAKVSA